MSKKLRFHISMMATDGMGEPGTPAKALSDAVLAAVQGSDAYKLATPGTVEAKVDAFGQHSLSWQVEAAHPVKRVDALEVTFGSGCSMVVRNLERFQHFSVTRVLGEIHAAEYRDEHCNLIRLRKGFDDVARIKIISITESV